MSQRRLQAESALGDPRAGHGVGNANSPPGRAPLSPCRACSDPGVPVGGAGGNSKHCFVN